MYNGIFLKLRSDYTEISFGKSKLGHGISTWIFMTQSHLFGKSTVFPQSTLHLCGFFSHLSHNLDKKIQRKLEPGMENPSI